jgi:enoyl-CoA hydratase/carnithine racemase
MQPILEVEQVDGVSMLTLNRPAQLNGLSDAMLKRLLAELNQIAVSSSQRVVVLQARGKAFCAGHDLKEMREYQAQNPTDRAYFEALFSLCSKVMQKLISMPQPVIAKVHGLATAAGCQLVAQCDLAVASNEAKFAVSGINLGLFCATPSVALTRNVGRKQAFEMLMTGDFLSAQEAQAQGLINQVVTPEKLDDAVLNLCESIKRKPFETVARGKSLFYKQANLGLAAAYQLAGQSMACNIMEPKAIEGIDAFLQKRPPNWNPINNENS